MRYLQRIAANGFLWQRDTFSTAVDLRIDDSLRSLDTLSFTLQYYYGTFLVSTGILLGYLFLFSFLSDADSSTSQNLLMSIIGPFTDPIALLLALLTRMILAYGFPIVEKKVINGLVDSRVEELGGSQTLNSRMRNKYRVMCDQAMREQWTEQQFIDQIKSATNELVANELRASQKQSDLTGIDYEDVKDAVSGESGTPSSVRDSKMQPLPFRVMALMSKPSQVAFGDEEVETIMYELPPEMDNMKRRMLWRISI